MLYLIKQKILKNKNPQNFSDNTIQVDFLIM